MAIPNGEIYHWLAACPTRGVSRKKRGGVKHKTAAAAAPLSGIDAAFFEAEQRVRELCKLSNRRLRRWMNDRLLRELAPTLDSQEIGSLFTPPPWGDKSTYTPFERVTGLGDTAAYDIAAWEPFCNNVDMDLQAEVLQPNSRPRKTYYNEGYARYATALAAWQTIERQARTALRRCSSWHLIQTLEEKVLDFKWDADNGCATSLAIEINDAYHRLLLHGVCQFHGFMSRSVPTWEEVGEDNKQIQVVKMHISKKKGWKVDDLNKFQESKPWKLIDFLREVRRELPSAGAAA